MTEGPDEAADLALVRELLFDNPAFVLEPFSDLELKSGSTPDFRVRDSGALAGFVEVKSPRDDWLSEKFDEAEGMPADERPEIVGGLRDDPTWNRLGRLAKKAAKQFAAVEHEGEVPRILIIVNHDKGTRMEDLRVTFRGYEEFSGTRVATFPGAAEGVRKAVCPHVDYIVFIDAQSRAVLGHMENEDRPQLAARARAILGGPAPGSAITRPPS